MLNTNDNKQASAVVHYCKICHRGFSCGGALGGHMRAHNIAEVINRIQEQQQQQDSLYRDNREGNKHSYFLRTTSNRFLNFQSSILGDNSSKRARLDEEKQFSPMSSLEEGRARKAYIWKLLGAEGDEKFLDGYFSREEEDLANVLVTLSNNSTDYNNTMSKSKTKEVSMPLAKGLFQCKACKKVFNSHQALGGHRASHKKVKGCYAAKLDDLTDDEMIEEDSFSHDEISMHQDSLDPNFKIISRASDEHDSSRAAAKVHECSICHRVFSSGQALGGHKRFHWLQTDSTFITPFHDQYQYYGEVNYKKSIATSKESELLDLNLPPDQTFDDKSTTTHTLPQRLNIQVDNDEENKGYQKCTDNEDYDKRSSKKVDCYEHNYNKEEASINKFPKHCSKVRDLKLDGGSSPWLQVGLASTTK